MQLMSMREDQLRAHAMCRCCKRGAVHGARIAILFVMLMTSCGTMRRPSEFTLGTATIVHPVRAREVGTAANTVASPNFEVFEAKFQAWASSLPRFADTQKRGICVLLPGILGKNSAPAVEFALREDGWLVIEVAPPLLDCVRAALLQAKQLDDFQKGCFVGAALDFVIDRAATATIQQLILVGLTDPSLRRAPLLVLGESLGAIMGVGLVATGIVPHDAAIFVAGGGSLLDVAVSSVIADLYFDRDLFNTPEFRRGYASTSRLDPLAAASTLVGCPVVVITAEKDDIVKSATQESLWIALGKPPRFMYEGGHLALFSFATRNIVPILRETAQLILSKPDAARRWFTPLEKRFEELLYGEPDTRPQGSPNSVPPTSSPPTSSPVTGSPHPAEVTPLAVNSTIDARSAVSP